jgi:hypothetical protein
MWNKFIDIGKSLTSFLQNGVAPPNTPGHLKQEMEDKNHLSSKKFFIVFTSIFFLAFFYFSSVLILFMAPRMPEFISGFVTLFSKVMEILAIIIATYLSVQTVVDYKINSNSNASIESINQNNKTVIEEKYEMLTHNAKEDDYETSIT